MRGSFRCGRFATARGSSMWARAFNNNLNAARGFGSVPSFGCAPSTWRMLAASSPMMSGKLSMLASASESPVSTGYAEQNGYAQTGMGCFSLSTSDEVAEDGDDVTEALAATPVQSHGSLMKSLSDVIVFGTNWANEMGKQCRLYN